MRRRRAPKMKILLSWSSGKDSAWALHVLRRDGGEVAGLLTSVNETAGRVSMHGVRRRSSMPRRRPRACHCTRSGCRGPAPTRSTKTGCGTRSIGRDRRVHPVAFGDLFLEDIRSYREEQLKGTGLTPLFPLWGRPTAALAREMIAGGLRARIATLDPRVMPRELIGAEFDESLLARLPGRWIPVPSAGSFTPVRRTARCSARRSRSSGPGRRTRGVRWTATCCSGRWCPNRGRGRPNREPAVHEARPRRNRRSQRGSSGRALHRGRSREAY